MHVIDRKIASEAPLVFVGTIVSPDAAEAKGLASDPGAAAVRIEELLQAPSALSSLRGSVASLRLPSKKDASPGRKAVFYVRVTKYGETISGDAIQVVPDEGGPPVAAMAIAGASTPVPDPAASMKDQRLAEALDESDLVVSGTVTSVHVPTEAVSGATLGVAAAAAAAAPKRPPRPVSEHDPIWREAVIEVEKVHKGRKSRKRVVLRFASSTDVHWKDAAKYVPGQHGVFLVKEKRTAAAPRLAAGGAMALAAAADGAGDVVAGESLGYQPIESADAVERLLSGMK